MIKRYIKAEEGNFSIVFAVSVSAIAFAMAVAMDVTRTHSLKTSLQDSLDNATFYAAGLSDDDSFKQDSIAYFGKNFENAPGLKALTVNFETSGDNVIGTASVEMPTLFGGLLNKDTMQIAAKSVVKIASEEVASPCIMALSTTQSPGVLINSGATINAPDCIVQVNSVGNPALTINAGTNLDVEHTCLAGGNILNNTGGSIATLESNCAVPPDPFAGKYPEPDSSTCDFTHGNHSSANVALTPGVYCGWFNFNNPNSTVTFAPGLYILKNGGWNVNGGDWSGDGITFYYADQSKIQFNSGVSASFTAPTRGDYAGVFMTESPSLAPGSSDFILNDNEGFDFEGVMYLPSRRVTFNGGVDLRTYKMNLVADSFVINTVNLKLESSHTSSSGTSGVVYLSE